jgi:Leucine Rich repeat
MEQAPKKSAYFYPFLEYLDLSGNHLQDSHMESLAKLVSHRFCHLKYLILNYNNVTTEGLGRFANCLAQEVGKNSTTMFPCLRELFLLNNPLSDEACAVFLDLLNILPQLNHIRSNVYWENTKDADAIQHMKEINWAGRVLLLKSSQAKDVSTHHTIALAVWPSVLARLAKRTMKISMTPFASISGKPKLEPRSANGIFHLLRHGPIFMHKNLATHRQCQPKAPTRSIEDSNRKRKRDPAVGGFCSLEEFLNHEATLEK